MVNLGLNTQRQAFENEYQAVIVALDKFGSTPTLLVQRRTRAFLAQALNSQNLGLAGTTLSGNDDDEAQRNSATALAAVTDASKRLWSCYSEGIRE